jgi:hypothetical protein
MTDSAPTFRTTIRGYDPAAVDYRIAELTAALNAAHQQANEMAERVRALTALAEDSRLQTKQEPHQPTYVDFGERVGQILVLAEEEATQIRAAAAAEVERKRDEIESSTGKLWVDADRYASETRAAAEREAGGIVEEAKRTADQLLADANRQAIARGEEAEAHYEHQRAQAAKAAADFEQTLAGRRDKSERAFQERTALAEKQLAIAEEQVAQLRAETEQSTSEAASKVERLTAELTAAAEQILAEAIARADRIRSESEQEVLVATQRRDSINAQLANVLHMLATLSGAARSSAELEDVPDVTDESPQPADAGQDTPVNDSAAEHAEDQHDVANESRQR